LISGPFHQGLVVVFTLATVLAFLGAVASVMRGAHTGAQNAFEDSEPAE